MQTAIIGLLLKTGLRYPVRAIGAIVGMMSVTIVGAFVGPYIFSLLLNQIQGGQVTLDNSLLLIGLYALTQIWGEILGMRLNIWMVWTFETAAQRDLNKQIFAKLADMSMSFHADRFTGSLVSQAGKLIGSFERFWDTIIYNFTPLVTSIITGVTLLSFIFWQYALVLATLSIIFIAAVYLGTRHMRQLNTLESQASTKLSGSVADMVTNVLAVKSHGAEQREIKEFEKHVLNWRRRNLALMRAFLGASTIYSTITALLTTGAVIGAVLASQYHIGSIGAIYLSMAYTLTIASKLWDMNGVMRSYNRIIGDAYDMTLILNTPPSVIDHTTKKLAVTKGLVEFKNMAFTHASTNEPLFDDFTLTIQPGERIGLVGHSGSGKTTLTKLLLRFADIDSGEILIDEQNISEVTQASLRNAIAYVPQEPLLFHRSLHDNIAYGRPGASDADVLMAAKKAHADEFIAGLKDGFDTLVGERGVKLSGGQKQRIAIARAILKDAPILVLDEATSALDSESEKLIQASLNSLMKDRTSIVIAHRLSTIQTMDRIVVLADGKIVEQGSHVDLLKSGGTYAELWKHQSGGFLEE